MKPARDLAVLLFVVTLAACGQDAKEAARTTDRDPAVSGALSDPLMSDPDLTNSSNDGAALGGGGPASAEVPPDKRTPEEAAAAKAAAELVFGGKIPSAPPPQETREGSRLAAAVSAPAIAAALAIGNKGCADKLAYSAIWAARLTPPFEVYPRGHAGQVAGVDGPGCTLRVVGFATPVGIGDVVDFYAARVGKAGLPLRRTQEGGDTVLQGEKGGAAYAVAVREHGDGMTEAVIVTSGL